MPARSTRIRKGKYAYAAPKFRAYLLRRATDDTYDGDRHVMQPATTVELFESRSPAWPPPGDPVTLAAMARLTAMQAITALQRAPQLTIEQARALLAADGAAHGMYSWWLTDPKALSDVPTTPHPTEPVGLLYVGVGPGTAVSKRTLPKRFGDHTKEAGRSTLRYGLASFLYTREGWTPVWRNTRPLLPKPDSNALSAWMATNLRMQLVLTLKPFCIEREVVHRMLPPLNRTHNQAHPFYDAVGKARECYRQAAQASHGAT